jgi:hypothetical protein
MAKQNLKIVVLPTYDVSSICVADASTYLTHPFDVPGPILVATAPGFPPVSVPFNTGNYNILTSDIFKISEPGVIMPLPDGVYQFHYYITPTSLPENNTRITIMRVDQLQEKFDSVFMTLDFMECDQAIKKQAKENLSTIYLLIQGSIAAANNCAIIEANTLYDKASNMLDAMIKKNCGCSGNNYNLYHH